MKLKISPLTDNPLTLMRRAGYAFQRAEAAEQSFVRELARGGYPRFHVYVKVEKVTAFINLHLDHKGHTYGDATRHHGEYAYTGAVKEETDRLLTLWGESAKIVE
jgi:hypothetical protein